MTVHHIVLCFLLTHLWDDDVIGIFGVAGQTTNINIVNPNPVAIGSQMTVTCSKDSIGGIGQLDKLYSNLTVSYIMMSYQVEETDKVELAKYKTLFLPQNIWRGEQVFTSSQPPNITKNNYKFEGRGESPYINNVDTMKLTLTVPEVTCELIATYVCEFEYYSPSSYGKKSFEENVTIIIAVSKVIMTAYQSRYHYGSYSVGESILFTCKINGTQNMTLEWEAAQCSAPNVYNKLWRKDQNFVIEDNSKDLTQTKCNDPVREYNIKLHYVTTKVYCFIRCVAYDKDGKKIENYHQGFDQNIVNGTKSVATKKPVSLLWLVVILCVCTASVICPLALGWRCLRKYKSWVVVYHDSTLSMTTHTLSSTEEDEFAHTKPETSVKPSSASDKTSKLSETPGVQQAPLIKRFSVAYTNLFDKTDIGLAGERKRSLFFGESNEEDD